MDGSNRPKPDISAPGVNIRSSVPGNSYQGGWSGTSMAGPHVAGLVALLISAQPSIRGQVDQIENAIEQSALHTPGRDVAVLGTQTMPTVGGALMPLLPLRVFSTELDLEESRLSPLVAPGEEITYTLTITHSSGISPTTNVVLTDTLPLGTTFVFATPPFTRIGDVIQWSFPSLEASGSRNVELTVQVNITSTESITNDDYAVRSDQVALVGGAPVVTQLEELHLLTLDKVVSAAMANPGDFITYTLAVANVHASIPPPMWCLRIPSPPVPLLFLLLPPTHLLVTSFVGISRT